MIKNFHIKIRISTQFLIFINSILSNFTLKCNLLKLVDGSENCSVGGWGGGATYHIKQDFSLCPEFPMHQVDSFKYFSFSYNYEIHCISSFSFQYILNMLNIYIKDIHMRIYICIKLSECQSNFSNSKCSISRYFLPSSPLGIEIVPFINWF